MRPKPSGVVRIHWLFVVAVRVGDDAVSLYASIVVAPNGEVVLCGRLIVSYPMDVASPFGPAAFVRPRKELDASDDD